MEDISCMCLSLWGASGHELRTAKQVPHRFCTFFARFEMVGFKLCAKFIFHYIGCKAAKDAGNQIAICPIRNLAQVQL